MREPADRQDTAGGTEHRRNATSGAEHGQQASRATGGFPPRVASYVRWATDSGALSAVTGAALLVRSGQSLRRGNRGRALVRALVGGLLFAVAVVQRRTGRRARHRRGPGRTGEQHDERAATDAGVAGSLTERGGPPTTGDGESTTGSDEGEKADPEPGDTLGGGTVATEEEAVELQGVDDESSTDEEGGTDTATGDEASTAGTDEERAVDEDDAE